MTSLALAVAAPLLLTARSAIGLVVSVSRPFLWGGAGAGGARERAAVGGRSRRKPGARGRTRLTRRGGGAATRVGRVTVMVPLAPTAVVSGRVQRAGRA